MSLCMVIASPEQSRALDITFKLWDATNRKPVPGWVERKAPLKDKDSAWMTILAGLNTGEGRYPNAKCTPPGILFRAGSYDLTYYLERSEMEKSCTLGEIVFHFNRKAYASTLEQALASDSPIISGASTYTKDLQVTVGVALKAGNYPVAATKSMLLRDEVARQFGTKAAEPYRVLADDIAGSAITRSEPLIFDPPQKKYVLAPSAIQKVIGFQKQVGVKSTGTLTWETARKLPDIGAVE